MLSFLLGLLFAGLIINLFIRMIFKTTPRRMIYDSITSSSDTSKYLQGYLAGITNLKMYYYIVGDMPTSNWLDTNKYKMLNDRPKLIKMLDEETKRGAGIIESEREV